MKIIHTADLHIGQDFYHNSRSNEHRCFFSQLAETARQEQPDAWIVSGDVFQSEAPTTEAIELYTHALLEMHEACPTMKIIVTAGNHDSPSRLAATRELWQLANVTVIGGRMDNIDNHIIDVCGKGFVLAAPYFYMRKGNGIEWFKLLTDRAEELNKAQLPVVLMAHTYIKGADRTGHDEMLVGGLEDVSAEALGQGFDYLAAGHIHRPQTLGKPLSDEFFAEGKDVKETIYESGVIRYAGSAVHVSFSEDYPHSISIVSIDKRGGAVTLKRRRIHELFAMKAVCKDDPKPLDEALEELRKESEKILFLPEDKRRHTYICLHVLIDRYLQDRASEQVRKILEANPYVHFCEFVLHRNPASQETEGEAGKAVAVEELQQMTPLQLAQLFYQRVHATQENPDPEIPEGMKSKLIEIISSVQK